MNQIEYDLENIFYECWHSLVNGANSAKHAFHCPSIATINDGFPEIRTVVLRKVIEEKYTLFFHTDYRSPKIKQIKENNGITWLFYDTIAGVQLRIKTFATIHYNNEITQKMWNEAKLTSLKCYLTNLAPATKINFASDGLPIDFSLSNENIAPGYANFAVIENVVKEIDWLFLSHDGNRRAKFIYENNEIKKYWIIP
jgi:pyridoxamine 5'-phosphate oxidase